MLQSSNSQSLSEDNIRRIEFCEVFMERINENEDVTKNILFSDGSSFSSHDRHNPSVVTYLS